MTAAALLPLLSHPLAVVSALWVPVGSAAAVLVLRRYLRTRHPPLAWFAAGWALIGLSQVEHAISWIVFPLLFAPRLITSTAAMDRANAFSTVSGAVAGRSAAAPAAAPRRPRTPARPPGSATRRRGNRTVPPISVARFDTGTSTCRLKLTMRDGPALATWLRRGAHTP